MSKQSGDVSFVELVTVLGQEKKLILVVTFVVCLVTAIVSILMKPIFTARTSLLPPQQSQSSTVLDQLGGLAGALGAGNLVKSPADMYIAFLKSNSVQDPLIEKFQLKERYKAKTLSETRGELNRWSSISLEKSSGLIIIQVSDPDPQFAADLANAYIDGLYGLMGKLSLSEAHQRRTFFEKQVQRTSEKPFQDIRVQDLILASLIRQYEMARIDEAREGPILQQVDKALPPDKRSKPKRTLMVIVAGIFGLLFGSFVGLIRSRLRLVNESTESAGQWEKFKKAWAFR